MKRHVKDNEERMTTTIKDLTKQFANSFSFLHFKKRKGQKYNTTHKGKIMTNGVILNVISNEEMQHHLMKKMKIHQI